MLNITLPDGSVRQFENPTNGAQIAAAIGSGLAKAAIAVVVNGEERDLSDAITADAHHQQGRSRCAHHPPLSRALARARVEATVAGSKDGHWAGD